ncbi:hypothetical protein ACFFMN_06475 [Planobispora siamensis]|uniref:Uncharacterized protein n=1 Tax=Planobispora siamensis TaxID=936338 RepID=A0A8J3SR74_9ACTN|nr:hypothetical protein [Planobispora siamensis]GIH97844.1 hypothetical protein Psi01_84740 [Planobispora siamensis]
MPMSGWPGWAWIMFGWSDRRLSRTVQPAPPAWETYVATLQGQGGTWRTSEWVEAVSWPEIVAWAAEQPQRSDVDRVQVEHQAPQAPGVLTVWIWTDGLQSSQQQRRGRLEVKLFGDP